VLIIVVVAAAEVMTLEMSLHSWNEGSFCAEIYG